MQFISFKKFFKKLIILFNNICGENYFQFIKGHEYINKIELNKLKKLVGKYCTEIESEYEINFAKIIGGGKCISYASCRMGFFSLLEVLTIKKDDEVILLGSSCAVMSNAVIKVGAKPVYSDVDINNFGSSLDSIKKKISNKTKVIVAQHSFGIPCEISSIKEFARSKNIFLIEDCALCVDSSIDGTKVGNFGDAAIFSTDHSKPINTLIGGIVYTRNSDIYLKLREKHSIIPNLSNAKQKSLIKQLIFEMKFNHSSRYFARLILSRVKTLKRYLFNEIEPYLTDDNKTYSGNNYPYPAKMPTFLAFLGLLELNYWSRKRKLYIYNMKKFLEVCEEHNIDIPKIYNSKRINIVPLRFVWVQRDLKKFRYKMANFIDINSFWFSKPIIEAEEPLICYGYKKGDCPNSEFIGPRMINLPTNLDLKELYSLIKKLKRLFNNFYKN